MNISILSGLIFVAVFAGVIITHEFGHFIVARLLNVEVEEFGIGFPPRITTLFHWKGTEFTLNWLPLGGFVRPKGENDPNIPGGTRRLQSVDAIGSPLCRPDDESFNSRDRVRLFVLSDGRSGLQQSTDWGCNTQFARRPGWNSSQRYCVERKWTNHLGPEHLT